MSQPLRQRLLRWLDSGIMPGKNAASENRIDWLRAAPFIALHLACLAVIWVGWSAFAVLFAALLYLLRMFAITGFYHRYFSHKTFRTSRPLQFLFAVAGGTAVQRGPLWWASQHRHHHATSEQAEDAHSPVQHGFLWSHMGWFLSDAHFATRNERVKELAQYPELRFLDRFDVIVPILFALAIFGLGEWLAHAAPQLGTDGWQLLVWGFVISTVALYHATFSVNSLAHAWGSRRYETRDQSRNNLLLALLTLGEGWHNNHHHYPGSARQGFYWWEIDPTWYGLRLLAACGLIWDMKGISPKMRESRRVSDRVKP